jgi:hypothetical protein
VLKEDKREKRGGGEWGGRKQESEGEGKRKEKNKRAQGRKAASHSFIECKGST